MECGHPEHSGTGATFLEMQSPFARVALGGGGFDPLLQVTVALVRMMGWQWVKRHPSKFFRQEQA
ncbi:hypothetical protein IMZ48_32025 [Candidatus Bathyarchaeota archaeon]|nr:hypothetical protein [Candidatus Bathyarchaeota archaeon]